MLIIQARMTSTRLPGKVMLPLCNGSVLQVMLDRLKDWKEQIIIATTSNGSEAPIVNLCQQLGIRYYQGSTDDVLSRYYEAALHFGAEPDTPIVRLTSDCPLIDTELTNLVIDTFLTGNYDMVSLGPHSGFPRGMDSCIFPFSLLALTHQKATLASDREHVTLGMNKFSSLNSYSISAKEDLSHYRLTLDEPEDYECIKAIYALFQNQPNFDFATLRAALESHPNIAKINQHVVQKSV